MTGVGPTHLLGDLESPPGKERREKNLLILHTPTFQDISDWIIVRSKITERAPDIEVRISSNAECDRAVQKWQTTRASLVFSPFRLLAYEPHGGTVYAGRLIGKMAEARRMTAKGLPVPRCVMLTPELVLDPTEWGEYVIVKPVLGTMGFHVRLVKTDELGARRRELMQNRKRPMLVQSFIDHTDAAGRLYSYRVLTMFGEPVYASERNCRDALPPLAKIAADPYGVIASNAQAGRNTGTLTWEADVLALSRRVATAFPDIPCLAQDIIRERESGALYILETNPQGFGWHLSSDFSRLPGHNRDFAQAKYEQFGALDIVANKLIDRTRSEAS